MCLFVYLLLWTLAPSPVEAVSAPGGGRGGSGVAVFLVTSIREGWTRRAAGVVVEEEIGSTAVGAASPTTASAPDVALRLQQKLSVHSFQLQIIHAKHRGISPGRHDSLQPLKRRNVWNFLTIRWRIAEGNFWTSIAVEYTRSYLKADLFVFWMMTALKFPVLRWAIFSNYFKDESLSRNNLLKSFYREAWIPTP